MKTDFLIKCYPEFEKGLLQEIEMHAVLKHFQKGNSVIRLGQYINYLPIIRNGCVKVYSHDDERTFLLYFIESSESCIYSFAHLNSKKQANFSAVAELDSDLLMLPVEKVTSWIKEYPSISTIILNNYTKHYNDLLNTTKQIISSNLEDRLLAYLHTKSRISGSKWLDISHKIIAADLGTLREVISRIMKSERLTQYIKQEGHKIKIL